MQLNRMHIHFMSVLIIRRIIFKPSRYPMNLP